MTKVFLALVGLMYVGLAVWCSIQPEKTSNKVGFELRPGSGQSEFMVIYGGLELALGLMFLAPLFRSDLTGPMILACLIVHACLFTFRVASFARYSGIEPLTYKLFAGECVLLALSGFMFWWETSRHATS